MAANNIQSCLFMFINILLGINVYSDTDLDCLQILYTPLGGQNLLVSHTRVIGLHLTNITDVRGLYLSASLSGNYSVRILNRDPTGLTNRINLAYMDYVNGFRHTAIEILALEQGRTELSAAILDSNLSVLHQFDPYRIKVANEVRLVDDVFLYVLASAEMLTLMMLGFRMRKDAIKEVLVKPCSLIAGIICQSFFMPLVAVGSALSLSLDQEDALCLLILGCCPTGVLSPMFSVLQHGHSELAIILLLLQTLIAFGVMPMWMFAYSYFLSDVYQEISFPFYQIAGTFGALTWPVLLGVIVQRCGSKILPYFEKTIHPTCLLLTLTTFTVSTYNLWQVWGLVTWSLLISSALIPLIGCFIGALSTAMFRRKISDVKSVALVTGIQNTMLAMVVIQTSYSDVTASLMQTGIVCMELSTLVIMYTFYILHLILWLVMPFYRSMHDNVGFSGVYRSIAEKIVTSMIKAGEISLRNRSIHGSNRSKSESRSSLKKSALKMAEQEVEPGSPGTSSQPLKTSSSVESTTTQGFSSESTASLAPIMRSLSTIGLKHKVFATSFESIRRLSQTPSFPTRHESLSGASSMLSYNESTQHPTTADLTDFETSEICLPSEGKEEETDSLSIDYEMLNAAQLLKGHQDPDTIGLSEGDTSSKGSGSDFMYFSGHSSPSTFIDVGSSDKKAMLSSDTDQGKLSLLMPWAKLKA